MCLCAKKIDDYRVCLSDLCNNHGTYVPGPLQFASFRFVPRHRCVYFFFFFAIRWLVVRIQIQFSDQETSKQSQLDNIHKLQMAGHAFAIGFYFHSRGVSSGR